MCVRAARPLFSVGALSLRRDRVVRGDQTPLARFLHPDVCEAVVIVVGFLAVDAFFVVDTGDDGCVAVHTNSHLRNLNAFYVGRGASAVREIAGLAVGAAVFKGDDEIVIENGSEDFDLVASIAVEKLEF